MRLLLAVFVLLILGLGLFLFSNSNRSEEKDNQQLPTGVQEEVERKASFAVFTNGTFRIFEDPRYHNKSSDVFIEAGNPNTVVVKKGGKTWQNFFDTLPMKLTKECLTTGTGQTFCSNETQNLKFYINGNFDKDALDRVIENGDKFLVTFGSENERELEEQLNSIP